MHGKKLFVGGFNYSTTNKKTACFMAITVLFLNSAIITFPTNWSSKDKDADCFISYVNAHGWELKSINLSQLFKNKKTRPYFALLLDNEIYIYVTSSYYTLSTLRTDIKKGSILGRINYFK